MWLVFHNVQIILCSAAVETRKTYCTDQYVRFIETYYVKCVFKRFEFSFKIINYYIVLNATTQFEFGIE